MVCDVHSLTSWLDSPNAYSGNNVVSLPRDASAHFGRTVTAEWRFMRKMQQMACMFPNATALVLHVIWLSYETNLCLNTGLKIAHRRFQCLHRFKGSAVIRAKVEREIKRETEKASCCTHRFVQAGEIQQALVKRKLKGPEKCVAFNRHSIYRELKRCAEFRMQNQSYQRQRFHLSNTSI